MILQDPSMTGPSSEASSNCSQAAPKPRATAAHSSTPTQSPDGPRGGGGANPVLGAEPRCFDDARASSASGGGAIEWIHGSMFYTRCISGTHHAAVPTATFRTKIPTMKKIKSNRRTERQQKEKKRPTATLKNI